MSNKSTPAKERIIPIQIEGREDNPSTNGEPAAAPAEPLRKSYSQALSKSDPPKEVKRYSQAVSTTDLPKKKEQVPVKQVQPAAQVSNKPIPEQSLPHWNTKEKIIFVIDRAEDENCTKFKLNSNSLSPLSMLKRSIEQFLHLKQCINRSHEYAVIVLNENNAMLLLDFTSNINEVISAVHKLSNCETEDFFNLNTLFDIILEHVEMPNQFDVNDLVVPPPYIVRTIMLYDRSYTLPELEITRDIDRLLSSPYFTFDVLMTHEPEDTNNNCSKIFHILQNVDQKGFAYFFSVGRNAKVLHDSVGKLLSHPLQRPIQSLAEYAISDVI